jgi:hypothetical protein
MEIKEPFRKKYVGYQTWNATMDDVFPLLCPVEEIKWTPKWNPKILYSNSSVIEKDCVFISSHIDDDAIWIVSIHDPVNYRIEMYQIIPNLLIHKYEINLFDEVDGRTKAEITYIITAISDSGINSVKQFTKSKFDSYMSHWEKALNYYLEKDEMIGKDN